MRRRALIGGAAAVAGAAAGTLALGWWRTTRAEAPTPLPDALGDMGWQLTDDRGQPTRPQDWIGRPALVFFGFTFCPNVCPTTLLDIGDWLADLGAEADRLAVTLVSVDPERDTQAALAEYLSYFDPRIRGLTLPGSDIATVAAAFRVRYARVPVDGGDYTMDHTAGVFLFYPDGRFANIIDFHEDRRFAVPKIRRILAAGPAA